MAKMLDRIRTMERGAGRVGKTGRPVGLTECDVRHAHRRLVARATSTCMTLRDEQAEGG